MTNTAVITSCQVRQPRPSELTILTYLLCCTVEFEVSVPDLFLDIMSCNEVSGWPRSRPRTVVACKSSKVWNVLGVLLVYK